MDQTMNERLSHGFGIQTFTTTLTLSSLQSINQSPPSGWPMKDDDDTLCEEALKENTSPSFFPFRFLCARIDFV
jgi:hypothetical protein